VLVYRESLWFRVISAHYSVEGGRLLEGGREASMWWHDIAALRREEWFSDHVSRSVGDKKHTLFWSDVWVGGVSFRDRFSRLFELSMFKGESVFDMCLLGWDNEGEAWRWRRRLFAWEEEIVKELRLLLQNVTLQVDREDRWLWSLESSFVYTIRSAYNLLYFQPHINYAVTLSSLWHKDVPLKVVLFAWRLFCDRLPTKDTLLHRRVIDNDAQMCVGGCDAVETFSYIVIYLGSFDTLFFGGLACLRLYLLM